MIEFLSWHFGRLVAFVDEELLERLPHRRRRRQAEAVDAMLGAVVGLSMLRLLIENPSFVERCGEDAVRALRFAAGVDEPGSSSSPSAPV